MVQFKVDKRFDEIKDEVALLICFLFDHLVSSDPLNLLLKVGAGTEAVGLFESIHLFVYKLMLQNQWSQTKGPFVLRTK
jgi:hypothetical protein